ncbi:ATP-binding protein [Streptomyces cylindrosporus]|uniref:ATP-binding protein n=1 Tax=Streptomyces cylindrosporus TaxID=2927583 RepID=A0ABS9YL19_9ACTN|nr:ATP-binding protein [Streptomyces cylindrosporus]MCI3277909.1 ATP-binding protein [Streptomyces cylindrosporus]
MTAPTTGYALHPYIGGRTAVLRALADWRAGAPGAPRVVVLTGSPGSGRSHLLTGFLMLCDPEFRGRLPLADLDPSTVPPELPAPAVPSAAGLTAAQLGWLIAEHYGVRADRVEEVYAALGALGRTETVVVPDVDRAGPVRTAGEPARVVREVLKPLAATAGVRLLADVPRDFAAELAGALPPGAVQVIDLDEPRWADGPGLVRQAAALLGPGADALLDPRAAGAPERPFTSDPSARRALAEAIARRAGTSPLVVQLAVQSILTGPATDTPYDEKLLPSTVGEAVDLHAHRLGADPQTLRQLLAPLALAEGDGLPIDLWIRLVNSLAGKDMSAALANSGALAGPFVESLRPDGDGGPRTLLRLLHPAVADDIRAGLPNVRAAQTRIAMTLLEAVPEQDWSKADPYVRDHIAGHTLEAGLLPQLLTDPGLFVHADPVRLRAAIEAVPPAELGAPARTYLRTAPLLTRTQAPAALRAALLETAFVEDGLPDYAEAIHGRLGLDLPWQTLWSLPVPGVSAVTTAVLPRPEGPGVPVAVLTQAAGEENGPAPSAVLVRGLVQADAFDGTDPAALLHPSEEQQAAARMRLSRGADYVRVWDEAGEKVMATLLSDAPFTAAALSPDGILVVATEFGAKALRIR